MRRAAKVDGNHASVMAAFRRMGCVVADTSRLGGGFPDLWVSMGGKRGVGVLVEIKDGSRPKCEQKLTDDEEKFHVIHPVEIVRNSMDDVARVVGMLRKRQALVFRETLAD